MIDNSMTESTRFLDPAQVDIHPTPDGGLCLVQDGERQPIGQIVRCFPFSSPDAWISLRAPDGAELALLKSLDGLPPEGLNRVRQALAARYHIPRIRRILAVTSGAGGALWRVETDDGPMDFRLRGDADISGFPRIRLTDSAARKRLEIPDYTALDRSSQAIARSHLPISRWGGPQGGRRRFR